MTFDGKTAINNPEAAFIMPFHPLVKQAAEFFKLEGKAHANLSVVSDLLPRLITHSRFIIGSFTELEKIIA